MLEDPFPDLQITDSTFLDSTDSRYKCERCTKSRKFFCYTCCTPNPALKDRLPKVKLPVKIDIIKHQSESDGKSTCPHAVVLAPQDVTVYTFPCIPDYGKEEAVLVFPCKEASTLKEMAKTANSADVTSRPPKAASDTVTTATSESGSRSPRAASDTVTTATSESESRSPKAASDTVTSATSESGPRSPKTCDTVSTASSDNRSEACPDNKTSSGKRQAEGSDTEESSPPEKRQRTVLRPFERAVFIDCTWNQTRNIIQDERLKELRRVELRDHETQFWRCHEGLATSCLSTIEAIYYFMREYHEDVVDNAYYTNDYDDLLFFFNYLYRTIRVRQRGGKDMKAYKRKLQKDQ
ncbi:hypothetical protein ACOMHN_043612 [Nucella lapillus]